MPDPTTRAGLARGLAALGVEAGDVLLVHSSLSAFGYLVGGAITACLALRDAVGPDGTLVMPGFTPQLCHPRSWRPSRLGGADPDELAAQMPCFDPAATPVAATVGAVPDCFRAMPGTIRSLHPHTSFLAQGPVAREVTGRHRLAYRLSSDGPLGRLWDLDAKVLMLGTPWSTCTAVHLAEYAVAYPGRRVGGWLVPVSAADGRTNWTQVDELLVWEGDFDKLGSAIAAPGGPTLAATRIGAADCRLVSLREIVRFAIAWLPNHRDLRPYADPPAGARSGTHPSHCPSRCSPILWGATQEEYPDECHAACQREAAPGHRGRLGLVRAGVR